VSNKTSLFYIFKNGIIGENPILRLMIGLCSVLAVSVKVENCLAMGAAVIFVTTCSSMVISLIRRFVPNQVRIPIFMVMILPPGAFLVIGIYIALLNRFARGNR